MSVVHCSWCKREKSPLDTPTPHVLLYSIYSKVKSSCSVSDLSTPLTILYCSIQYYTQGGPWGYQYFGWAVYSAKRRSLWKIFCSQEKFHTINCSPLGRSFTAFDVSEFTWWKWLIPVISLRNVSCKEAELQSMEWLDSIYHAFNFEELKWGIKSEYLILTSSLQRHTSNCKYQWILKCLSDIWYRT